MDNQNCCLQMLQHLQVLNTVDSRYLNLAYLE